LGDEFGDVIAHDWQKNWQNQVDEFNALKRCVVQSINNGHTKVFFMTSVTDCSSKLAYIVG
jgi:hypothetical protein